MPHPWLRLVNHVALRSSAPPALFSAARSARVLSCCCPSLQFSSPLYRGFSPHLQLSRSFSDQPKLDFEKKEKGLFKIATIPNALCAARIAATPVIGYFIVVESFSTAFSLFLAASVTDLLDGYIARNVPGQRSLLGSVLDPVADKLLISTMFITMTYAALIPIYLTSIVLLRDVCLIVGGFYKRYKMMQPPYSLDRFFNPQVSSMQIVPTLVSKVNTVLQITLVAASLASPIFEFSADAKTGIFYLGCLTAFTTVYSGLQYAAGQGFKRLKNPLKFRQKQ